MGFRCVHGSFFEQRTQRRHGVRKIAPIRYSEENARCPSVYGKKKPRSGCCRGFCCMQFPGLLFVVSDHLAHQLFGALRAAEAQRHFALGLADLAFEATEVAPVGMCADENQLAAAIGGIHLGAIHAHRMGIHARCEIHIATFHDDKLAACVACHIDVALDRQGALAVIEAGGIDFPSAGKRAVLGQADAAERSSKNGSEDGGFGKRIANHEGFQSFCVASFVRPVIGTGGLQLVTGVHLRDARAPGVFRWLVVRKQSFSALTCPPPSACFAGTSPRNNGGGNALHR